MTLDVRFSEQAAAEIDDAAEWYDARRTGLGDVFVAAVDAAVKQVAEWPDAGALVDGLPPEIDVRRAPVARFPYHLAYLATGTEVRILAVAHHRRRPNYWAERAST